MRLRVLVSTFACSPGGGSERLGGGELVLGWNAVHQLARFHNVVALTHSEHRSAIEESLGHSPNAHLEFHYFALPRWLEALKNFQGGIQLYAYFWQINAYFAARQLHRRYHFDVFHHVTYANDWMASFIGALLPIPILRGPGGGANKTPARFLKEYQLRDRLWERLRTVAQWLLRRDPFFVLGRRRARAILVCNCESQQAVPLKWRNKTKLFPVNGISLKDFALLGSSGHKEGFHVLSAGKLLHWKGFPLALRAFAAFASKHTEAQFTIAGDGPEFPRLVTLVDELGLSGRVHLGRWLSRNELLPKMNRYDVFLYASLRDGGGAVIVEAMAAGMPVICLDLGGPGMHVTDDCGIKVPANSPEQAVSDMALALERLYHDQELRHRMGSAGRERAEKSYHWDRLGERLLEIYHDALQAEPSTVSTRGNDECMAAAADLH